jgi:hypothetical protein
MHSGASTQGNGDNGFPFPSNVRARTRARARIINVERALHTVATVANADDCWANRQSETVAQTVANSQTVASPAAVKFPWTIAGLIADVLRTQQTEVSRKAPRYRLQLLQEEIGKLRNLLIDIFAERLGWRPSKAWFTPSMLAKRGVAYHPWRDRPDWSGGFVDHGQCFRSLDRRAAAFASNPYGLRWTADHPDIRAFCEHFHLSAAIPDFPSWWFPGRTTLIVFTPLAADSVPADLQESICMCRAEASRD